jgi:SAM-dependent methyltransferase
MKANVEYNVANSCRLCGSQKIETLLPLADMPPGDLYRVSKNESFLDSIPSYIQFCPDCTHMQMSASANADLLYSNYLSRPAATNQMLSDIYKDYAEEIMDLSVKGRVLEIGSNDGLFLQALGDLGVNAVGIEPARNLHEFAVETRGVKSINDYFSQDLVQEYGLVNMDLVFANHSISNIENIQAIATSVGYALKEDGVFIIQTFYQLDVFEKQLIENYNHEHLSYFTIRSLKKLFALGGLSLFKVRYINAKGGSIRCYFRKSSTTFSLDKESENLILREKNLDGLAGQRAKETMKYIEDRANKINEIVSSENHTSNLCAYGTSIGATVFTYQFRLQHTIKAFFDDDSLRQNRFSPGLGIQVLPSKYLNAKEYPYCIITAPLYATQIMAKNEQYMLEGGKFITFWPEVEVHGQ